MHSQTMTPIPDQTEHTLTPREAQPRREPLQVSIDEAARLLSFNARTIRRLIAASPCRACTTTSSATAANKPPSLPNLH